MGIPVADSPERLASHLRAMRGERGLTLQALAERSGVSRATLSRIENGEVSPTAETLGRMAAALAMPISRLLAPMEQGLQAVIRRADQSVWRDPDSGFTRRSVSPPSGDLRLELIEGRLEPHSRISYVGPAVAGQEHHLVLLSGSLSVTLESAPHDLRPGDCLRYRLYGASRFETRDEGAVYLIALI